MHVAHHDDGSITVDQRAYINAMLTQFGIAGGPQPGRNRSPISKTLRLAPAVSVQAPGRYARPRVARVAPRHRIRRRLLGALLGSCRLLPHGRGAPRVADRRAVATGLRTASDAELRQHGVDVGALIDRDRAVVVVGNVHTQYALDLRAPTVVDIVKPLGHGARRMVRSNRAVKIHRPETARQHVVLRVCM
jgi:hypothetical protein